MVFFQMETPLVDLRQMVNSIDMEALTSGLFLNPKLSDFGFHSWPVDPNREHRRSPLSWWFLAVCSIAATIVFSRSRSFDRISDACQVRLWLFFSLPRTNPKACRATWFSQQSPFLRSAAFSFFVDGGLSDPASWSSHVLKGTLIVNWFGGIFFLFLPWFALPDWLPWLSATTAVAVKSIWGGAVALFTTKLSPGKSLATWHNC